MKRILNRKKTIAAVIISAAICFFIFWNCLPDPLFQTPVSTVLLDRNGNLLGARIADDGQWRFPRNEQVSARFCEAIVCFEDKRFYHHPGVDALAIARASMQHLRDDKMKSGGSTLTMQVIRLIRKGKPRTIGEKIIEMLMALRLECTYSKKEILALYASQAPFGTNTVGLEAAAWRYFGKNPSQLSWGETATLAVLPNSPSLVHPGKNTERLREKRNRLLNRLYKSGAMDSLTCMASQSEPLPGKPLALPQLATHLLTRTYLEKSNEKKSTATVVQSTLDKDLQSRVTEIVMRHHTDFAGNGINNAAAIVADVETGNVLAYVGNIYSTGKQEYEENVDVLMAPRSTGSILKPFLYAAMLSEGEILPNTLVPDIPTQIAGYSPQNFNKEYDGAVPAKRALERSLNIPAVRLLRTYGYDKFNFVLKKAGMTTLSQPADHYGLSIILGGAEGSVWDIAGMYASMARTLNHYGSQSGRYNSGDFHPLRFEKQAGDKIQDPMKLNETGILSAASIWCTFNAMEEVNRPDIENNWRQFSSSQRIAWKTGTSFGFRDGWAVGCTPKYVVAVWVGNADGEGRPNLTGISTAAPVMFDIFKLLKTSAWFEQPFDEMEKVEICKESGYRASPVCDSKDSMWVPRSGLKTAPCPFHQLVHLDANGKYRVSSECESPSRMKHLAWFVLPPAQEWFYKSKNPNYKTLPPYRPGCDVSGKTTVMEFIYPKKSTQIYVPIELDGSSGKTIFEVAHRSAEEIIYWNLDDEYIGSTKGTHQMALNPSPGKHLVTLVDQEGQRLEQVFEILKKDL